MRELIYVLHRKISFSRFPMYFLSTSLFGLLPKASEILFFGGFRCISSPPACFARCRKHRKFCFSRFPMYFLLTSMSRLLPKASENLFSCCFRCISSSPAYLARCRRHRKLWDDSCRLGRSHSIRSLQRALTSAPNVMRSQQLLFPYSGVLPPASCL